MNARQIMTEHVVSIISTASARDARAMLAEHGVGGMPVLSEAGQVLGMLSESDLQDAPGGTPVKDLMTSPPFTVQEETPVEEIAILLKAHKVNRLPVLRGEKLVGIVTRDDVISYVASKRAWERH